MSSCSALLSGGCLCVGAACGGGGAGGGGGAREAWGSGGQEPMWAHGGAGAGVPSELSGIVPPSQLGPTGSSSCGGLEGLVTLLRKQTSVTFLWVFSLNFFPKSSPDHFLTGQSAVLVSPKSWGDSDRPESLQNVLDGRRDSSAPTPLPQATPGIAKSFRVAAR